MVAARKSLEPYLKDEVEYYPHQIEGIRRGARMRSFLLADDMGLGKSLQALTIFCMDVKMGLAETLLIVCPVSLRMNWADEIEKFTRIPYTLLGEEENPHHKGHLRKISTTKKREEQLLWWLNVQTGPRILIVNYEQVSSAIHEETFSTCKFDTIIYDEAHYIKNPKSNRTKGSLRLRSTRSLLLTGTPMLNNPDELWSILNRIDPKRWPKYYSFVNRFCVLGGYNGKQAIGTKNQTELVGILSELMIRRLKKDVLTLPVPRIVKVKVGLSDYQEKLYTEAQTEMTVNGMDAGIVFMRLMQICSTPYSVDRSLPDDSEKLDRMTEIATEVLSTGEKLVIFTQFRGVLECIVNRLNKALPNIPVFQLHGDVPPSDRVGVIKEWSSARGPAVVACMLQVAGVGLNMTAASTAIFVDKLFVPGLNQQAIDRLHRIGASETQAVQIFELIARGTYEDRIERILREKQKIFGEIVEGGVSMKKLLEELMKAEAEDGMLGMQER